MPYVDRDAGGSITGVFANPQRPGQEELPEGHPDIDAFLHPPPTQEAVNEASLHTKVKAAIADLEAAAQAWPSLTNAQKDAALRLNVRVTARLARLAVRQLDADT